MSEQNIILNNRPYPYKDGATITSIMSENNYVFRHIIAKLNGAVIEEEQWQKTRVSPGDKLELIHIFGGG